METIIDKGRKSLENPSKHPISYKKLREFCEPGMTTLYLHAFVLKCIEYSRCLCTPSPALKKCVKCSSKYPLCLKSHDEVVNTMEDLVAKMKDTNPGADFSWYERLRKGSSRRFRSFALSIARSAIEEGF